jgi:hypothetical protein
MPTEMSPPPALGTTLCDLAPAGALKRYDALLGLVAEFERHDREACMHSERFRGADAGERVQQPLGVL